MYKAVEFIIFRIINFCTCHLLKYHVFYKLNEPQYKNDIQTFKIFVLFRTLRLCNIIYHNFDA